MTALADLRSSRELLVNLTQREVSGKYKRTALGQAWSLLNPLATMLVFTIVFSKFLRITPDVGNPSGLNVFALFLLSALLPWNFFANAATGGMGSLLANANLVKKVYFPREILVAATVLSFDVTFVIEMLLLAIAVIVVSGTGVLPFLPLVPVFMVVLTAFGLGIGLVLSVANVYFRDTAQFVGIGMQVWFYLTPIVYPLSYLNKSATPLLVPGTSVPVTDVLRANPMTRFVDCFRALLYDQRLPSLGDTVYVVVAAALSLMIGYWIFSRFEGRMAEEL